MMNSLLLHGLRLQSSKVSSEHIGLEIEPIVQKPRVKVMLLLIFRLAGVANCLCYQVSGGQTGYLATEVDI